MLQLITLNTWGGKVKGIIDFISNNKNIDIFCFQEIFKDSPNHVDEDGLEYNGNIFSDIQNALPEHNGYFRACYDDIYGLATFVSKSIKLEKEDEIYIYKEKGYKSDAQVADHGRNMQLLSLNINGDRLNVFNLHGLWTGTNKGDTEDRIEQSRRVIEYMSKFEGAKVLCGDFNLLPDTQSIKMIEDADMSNLIKENNITSTRTSYYHKNVPFADYVFVDKGVKVSNFEVMKEEVSDHTALKLAFEL